MTPYLLRGRAGHDPVYELATKKQGFTAFIAARIMSEPISFAPNVIRANYFGMFRAVYDLTALEKKMAHDTPGRGDVELLEQSEQSVHHNFPFDRARSGETPRTKQV